MSSNFFAHTLQIVSELKYFDVSRDEILRQLEAGDVEFESEHQFVDDFGNEWSTVLRLNISCRNNWVRGWTISLKMHKERIDGIDWEPYFTGLDGTRNFGWHRHVWSRKDQSAKAGKICVQGFDDVDNREDFVIRALKEMNVTLSKTDYGTDELPFD